MAGWDAIRLAAIDPALCSDDDIGAIHAVTQSIARETGADEEPLARTISRFRASAGLSAVSRYWLATDTTGAAVGTAGLHCRRAAEPRRIAGFGLDVLPHARRHRVGTRLLAAVLEAAAAAKAELVQTWTLTGGLGEPFLRSFGGRLGSVSGLNELDIATVDRAMLDLWVSRAQQRASEYSLVEWVGAVPAGLRDELVRVMSVMNTAPTDDLETEERHMTAAELEQEEARALRDGWEGRGIAARHNVTGALVGYTALGIIPGTDIARQGDTVVEVAHRNRGIGRWLKARMLLRLLDERPDVHRIRTDNAVSNAPMLSINTALGFRTVRSNGIWQVPVEGARRIAQARLSSS